jgi:hypothetical protein
MLMSSAHPGIMDIVVHSLAQNYPHPKAMQAIRSRHDPEFVCHLLRRLPKRLSQVQQKNLREIDAVTWLDGGRNGLEIVPPGLQPALIAFVDAIGIPHEEKQSVHEWILKHGGPEGRMAAVKLLGTLDKRAMHDAVLDSLDSNDEDIQAWATTQLRTQAIPEAFTLLIDRLDSQSAIVRDAAREELSDFNIRRVLGLFDHLSPETCERIGALLQKIDPNCVAELRREMASPVQRHRIRAARAAEAMNLHRQVLPALLAMAEDADPLVRRTAAEMLGDVPESDAVRELKKLSDDSSQRVREAAARSLSKIEVLLMENRPR